MSNAPAPNDGYIDSAIKKVSATGQAIVDGVNEQLYGAQKEGHKEQMKGNTGDSSLSSRADGALGAAKDKLNESSSAASKEANNQQAKAN